MPLRNIKGESVSRQGIAKYEHPEQKMVYSKQKDIVTFMSFLSHLFEYHKAKNVFILYEIIPFWL